MRQIQVGAGIEEQSQDRGAATPSDRPVQAAVLVDVDPTL